MHRRLRSRLCQANKQRASLQLWVSLVLRIPGTGRGKGACAPGRGGNQGAAAPPVLASPTLNTHNYLAPPPAVNFRVRRRLRVRAGRGCGPFGGKWLADVHSCTLHGLHQVPARDPGLGRRHRARLAKRCGCVQRHGHERPRERLLRPRYRHVQGLPGAIVSSASASCGTAAHFTASRALDCSEGPNVHFTQLPSRRFAATLRSTGGFVRDKNSPLATVCFPPTNFVYSRFLGSTPKNQIPIQAVSSSGGVGFSCSNSVQYVTDNVGAACATCPDGYTGPSCSDMQVRGRSHRVSHALAVVHALSLPLPCRLDTMVTRSAGRTASTSAPGPAPLGVWIQLRCPSRLRQPWYARRARLGTTRQPRVLQLSAPPVQRARRASLAARMGRVDTACLGMAARPVLPGERTHAGGGGGSRPASACGRGAWPCAHTNLSAASTQPALPSSRHRSGGNFATVGVQYVTVGTGCSAGEWGGRGRGEAAHCLSYPLYP